MAKKDERPSKTKPKNVKSQNKKEKDKQIKPIFGADAFNDLIEGDVEDIRGSWGSLG